MDVLVVTVMTEGMLGGVYLREECRAAEMEWEKGRGEWEIEAALEEDCSRPTKQLGPGKEAVA